MYERQRLPIGLAFFLGIFLVAGSNRVEMLNAKAEKEQDLAGIKNTVGKSYPTQYEMNTSIPYAGRLSKESGQLADEAFYDFSFALYATEKGEELLWSEEQANVAVSKAGLFSISLGDSTPLPADMLNGRDLWLATSIRSPGENEFTNLVPRQKVSRVDSTANSSQENDQACPHDHFGESWISSNTNYGLWIQNSGSGDGLQVNTAGVDSNGVLISRAGGVGLQVSQSNDDGVYVYQAGNPASSDPSAYSNGVEVAGAEGSGLWVGYANLDGVTVEDAGWYGLYIVHAENDGVRVDSAGGNGVMGASTDATNYGGLFRNYQAGGAGLYAAGGDNSAPDLILGTNGAGDDGRIYSLPSETGSDILLFSNDEAQIHLDEDNNSSSAFTIYNGENSAVFSVNEAGVVTYGSKDGVNGSISTYSIQTTGGWMEDFGSAQLVQNQTIVTINPIFAQMVKLDEYHVFLTPLGDCSLYVTNKTPTTFTVNSISGQQCSVAFDYRIVAKQASTQGTGMELTDSLPEDDD